MRRRKKIGLTKYTLRKPPLHLELAHLAPMECITRGHSAYNVITTYDSVYRQATNIDV